MRCVHFKEEATDPQHTVDNVYDLARVFVSLGVQMTSLEKGDPR